MDLSCARARFAGGAAAPPSGGPHAPPAMHLRARSWLSLRSPVARGASPVYCVRGPVLAPAHCLWVCGQAPPEDEDHGATECAAALTYSLYNVKPKVSPPPPPPKCDVEGR